MKRFLFSLLLCASAVAQAPLAHNSFTTNAPGKTPPLLTTSTSPLYPLMVLLPDGSGADRTVAWAPQFFMSNGVAHFTGLINDTALSGNTLLRIDAGKNINNMIGGSPGALAKWTSTGLIGNSVMTDDGTSINVNNLAVSNQLALQWLSNVIPRINGSGQVSGTTIGSNLSFDGVTLSANGDTIWTNDAGVTHPVDLTIPVVIGTTANTYGNNFYIYTPTNGSSGYAHTIVTGAPFLATGLSVDLLGDNYTGTWGEGFYAGNLLPAINGDRAMYYNVGQYGILGEVNPQVSTNGQTIGVFGVSDGYGSVQYGLSGMAQAFDNGQTNIGVAGTSLRNSKTGVFVGGYFEANDTTSADPNYESATLLLDNRATALPLLTARTNNGTTVFQVGAKGSVLLSDSAKLGDYYIYPLKAGNGISLSTNANPTSGTNLTATVTNVTEAQLTLAANTTADVSTTKHGFAPVLPNDSTKFLNGVGTYTVPAGGISGSGTANRVAKWSSSSAIGNATPTDDGSIWDFGNVMSTVRIPDGSAPVPGLAFSIQTNLGIARLADTALSIIAGGAEVAAFGNGNFGSYNGLKFSSTATMKMPSGAGAGKVLTSDAAGSASWQNILSVNTTNVTTPNLQDTATVTWARSLSNLTANAQPSAILDVLGSTRGSILYRGASGWAALTPGTAGYALTANGVGADPTYQAIPAGGLVTSASQFSIVGGSASGTANGTALLAAYTVAQTATPNGNALAANNRYTILLLPGVYDLGSSTLTMDTPFVDIVGLSLPAWQSTAVWSATDNGNTVITSSSGTATITVSASSSQDVLIARVALVNSGSGKAFNPSADANQNTKLIQVLIVNTGSTNNDSMTQNRSFNGLYVDCISRNYDSFGTGTGDAGGKFYRCKARANSFGGSVSGGTGTASGQFWDSEADGDSFGKQTSSGKYFRCRMVTINTGGDVFGLASGGTASGTYIECQGGDGTASFGGNGGTMSGLMVGCFPSTGTATTLAQASVTGEIRNCPLYIGWNGPYAMNTADSTQISNTASESNFSTTKSIAASAWKVGRAFTWQAWGKYSCTNVTPGTITFKTKFGATAANTSDALALPAGGTANSGWVAQGMFVCRTIGATGTVSSQSKWEMDQGTLGILNESLKPSNGTTTIANNGSLTFQISVTFSAASASNAATLENFLLVPLDAN